MDAPPLTRRQLLTAAALTAATAACRSSRSTGALSSPVPAAFDVCGDRSPASFSILTWNIFMMPPWVRESPRNVPRAHAIGARLLEESFDILCLEKAFDAAARDAIVGVLGDRYPYRYGPANDGPSVELSSGVWVLSRTPLTDYRAIEFDDCSGIECLSRKGAMLLSGRCGAASFRLIATHLQGEEGPEFTEKNRRVRHLQMGAIRDRLILPNVEQRVPIFVCGDMGTPRFTPDGSGETDVYRDMLATLGAENGGEPRITLDETASGSQLVKDGSGRRNELDYVLVQPNGATVRVERARHVFRRGGWDLPSERGAAREDLSYRYGVSARLTFAAP